VLCPSRPPGGVARKWVRRHDFSRLTSGYYGRLSSFQALFARARPEKETAMAKFLSDEWFAKVKEITEGMGDIDVPASLKDLTFNLTVATDEGDKKVHMAGGQFAQGHKADASVTVILPAEAARKIFLEADQQAGMQAFMSGQMRVEGDVTKLMVLQTVQPTDDLKDLMADIIDITE
jgi:putative sterol carrier protein